MMKSITLLATLLCLQSFAFGQVSTSVEHQVIRGCNRVILPHSSAIYTEQVVQKIEENKQVLDITDPEIDGLLASPNPTKGHLSVSVPADLIGREIVVIDMTGRFVGNPIPIQGTTETFTIEGESGMYLLVIETEEKVITQRIQLATY